MSDYQDHIIRRLDLIIERIRRSPATYNQIERYLLNSTEFDNIEKRSYSIRTLQRDLLRIKKVHSVEISAQKGTGGTRTAKEYKIIKQEI